MEHREEQENIHELMRQRWSPRAYSTEPLTSAEIESLFQAARWAPSSSNMQPWRFVYATKDQEQDFQKLLGLLVEANAIWAKDAPFIMAVFSLSINEKTGEPHPGHLYDTGLAMSQFNLQATALGLQVHQMAGFHTDQANDTLGVPPEYVPIAMAVVGHVTDPSHLPEKLQEREKTKSSRKSLPELVHQGVWQGEYQHQS